jgi:hypothetical protein
VHTPVILLTSQIDLVETITGGLTPLEESMTRSFKTREKMNQRNEKDFQSMLE